MTKGKLGNNAKTLTKYMNLSEAPFIYIVSLKLGDEKLEKEIGDIDLDEIMKIWIVLLLCLDR